MPATWLRVLSVFIPLCLFAGSAALLGKVRNLCTILQLAGSAFFLGVVLIHSSAGLRAWTNWLAAAGLCVFSVAFVFYAFSKK